jgi:hypothetical protein
VADHGIDIAVPAAFPGLNVEAERLAAYIEEAVTAARGTSNEADLLFEAWQLRQGAALLLEHELAVRAGSGDPSALRDHVRWAADQAEMTLDTVDLADLRQDAAMQRAYHWALVSQRARLRQVARAALNQMRAAGMHVKLDATWGPAGDELARLLNLLGRAGTEGTVMMQTELAATMRQLAVAPDGCQD